MPKISKGFGVHVFNKNLIPISQGKHQDLGFFLKT